MTTTKRPTGSITPHNGGWRVRVTEAGERRSCGVYDDYGYAEEILAAELEAARGAPTGNALVWPTKRGGCHGASYSAEWARWKVRAGIEPDCARLDARALGLGPAIPLRFRYLPHNRTRHVRYPVDVAISATHTL